MSNLPLHERLRQSFEVPNFDEYGVPEEARKPFYCAMGRWILDGAHGFFMPPEADDGHTRPEEFIEVIVGRFHQLNNAYNGATTQSPIEDMLLGSLLWMEADWAGFIEFDFLGDGPSPYIESVRLGTADAKQMEFMVTSQAAIAGHKVDFLVWVTCGRSCGGVVVECDGHAFHEKTKEQAARDKRRDREILAAGYPVMRFAGSEIFKDPGACVEQVREIFQEVLVRVSKEGGLF